MIFFLCNSDGVLQNSRHCHHPFSRSFMSHNCLIHSAFHFWPFLLPLFAALILLSVSTCCLHYKNTSSLLSSSCVLSCSYLLISSCSLYLALLSFSLSLFLSDSRFAFPLLPLPLLIFYPVFILSVSLLHSTSLLLVSCYLFIRSSALSPLVIVLNVSQK